MEGRSVHCAAREEPSLRSRDIQDAPQPIRSGSHDAPGDPILRLLRRRRRLLSQTLRAVDSILAAAPDNGTLLLAERRGRGLKEAGAEVLEGT